MTTQSSTAQRAEQIPARAWLTLIAVIVGALVFQLDGIVVGVANPGIAAGLRAGPAGIQWVNTAQLLALAGLAIPAGTLADRFGRKRMFLLGVGGFTAASLLCGLAPSIEVLIGGRVLQGACGALLLPAALGSIRAAFPPGRLPTALGVFGSAVALVLTVAPPLAGALVEKAGWSWAFFAGVPFGVAGVVLGALVMTDQPPGETPPLDLPGAAAATLGITALVWAFTGAQQAGWASARTIGFAAASLLLLIGFVVLQRISPHPLIPLGLFRSRSFTIGLVLLALALAAMSAVTFFLMFFLQGVQGKGGFAATVALLPLTVVLIVSPSIGGLLTQRLGARTTLLLGAACYAVAFAFLLRLTADSGAVDVGLPLALAGFGNGLLTVSAMEAILGGVPAAHTAAAAGVKEAVGEIGGTIGIAGFGTLLGSVVGFVLPGALRGTLGDTALTELLMADHSLRADVELGFAPAARDALLGRLIETGIPADAAARAAAAVTAAAHRAFVDGMHAVYAVCVGAAILASLLALLLRDPRAD
ncbi:MFS transporter [Nocardia arthritidis]|nr:MFS transporter [Nocardia arthritidis]